MKLAKIAIFCIIAGLSGAVATLAFQMHELKNRVSALEPRFIKVSSLRHCVEETAAYEFLDPSDVYCVANERLSKAGTLHMALSQLPMFEITEYPENIQMRDGALHADLVLSRHCALLRAEVGREVAGCNSKGFNFHIALKTRMWEQVPWISLPEFLKQFISGTPSV